MATDHVYWDSNAFLGLINGEADKSPGCDAVWTACERGLLNIVTSTLTVAEVIYMKGVPKLDPSKRSLVSNFFRQPFIIQMPVTRTIAEIARDVVWDIGTKPKDAIHVATACHHNIGLFHTFDGPLLSTGKFTYLNATVLVSTPDFKGIQAEMKYGPKDSRS